jgi:hypothetical protein
MNAQGTIVDRLAADRDIVGIHNPVNEADAEPACDEIALQPDHAVEQCEMRIDRLCKVGEVAANHIVG